ncbi:hypothetical protein LINGRAHAP2_LOCUS20588 [Linum grandiflorum]
MQVHQRVLQWTVRVPVLRQAPLRKVQLPLCRPWQRLHLRPLQLRLIPPSIDPSIVQHCITLYITIGQLLNCLGGVIYTTIITNY